MKGEAIELGLPTFEQFIQTQPVAGVDRGSVGSGGECVAQGGGAEVASVDGGEDRRSAVPTAGVACAMRARLPR